MTRSYRYRLLPTRRQAAVLFEWLRLTRELYNAALQERRDAWAKQRISVSRFDQQRQIKDIRADRPDVAGVPVVVCGACGGNVCAGHYAERYEFVPAIASHVEAL